MAIAQYTGITVMLPAAVVIALWLWCNASRQAAGLWVGALAASYTVVGASKLLYKGWGIGLPSLDIAVFSGHAMNTCLVVTVGVNLLSRQVHPGLRWPAAAVALAASWWFSFNYIAPLVHPLPEAIAGALIGSVAALAFLLRLEGVGTQRIRAPAIMLGVVVIALSGALPKVTAESLLNRAAISLSGAQHAFLRPAWRATTVELPGGEPASGS